MEEKKNNSNKVLLIILLIIILILLVLLGYFIFNQEESKQLTPSGNVDVFEIECDYNCDCSTDDTKTDDKTDITDKEDKNDIPVFKHDDDLNVTDNNITWNKNTDLRIFENSMYNNDSIIAPESTNIYQFVIRNNTIYNIIYSITFNETNIDNINMKYRLKRDKEYVAGDEKNWITYNELSKTNIKIATTGSHTYYLEWKWFSSDNDTAIGEKGNVNYNLGIYIKAEQDNG